MHLFLAQMTAGAAWAVPLLLLATFGLACGMLAWILRVFLPDAPAGRLLGWLALAIGVGTPIFMGTAGHFSSLGIGIAALPAVPGLIAIAIVPRAEPRGFDVVMRKDEAQPPVEDGDPRT